MFCYLLEKCLLRVQILTLDKGLKNIFHTIMWETQVYLLKSPTEYNAVCASCDISLSCF